MTYAAILKFDSSQPRNPAGSPEGGRWSKGLTPGWSKAPPLGAGKANGAHERWLAATKAKESHRKSGPQDRTPHGEHINSLVTPAVEHSSSSHKLGGGINESIVVEIEGKEFVFKPVSGEAGGQGGEAPMAEREVIASRLDTELELGLTPPTVMGDVDGRQGSLQDFIADAETWGHYIGRGEPPEKKVSRLELAHMAVFDILLANTDRHSGNAMVKDGKLYAIDHGYSMGEKTSMKVYSFATRDLIEGDMPVTRQRELAERIASMDVARVLEGSHLNTTERGAFDIRRGKIVDLLRKGKLHEARHN